MIMVAERAVCFCILFIVVFMCIEAGKYSEDVNVPSKKKFDAPFRMNKVNLVWQKANKRLSSSRLADLYTDLKLQDQLEMQAKTAIGHGMDSDGEHVAAARHKFLEIIEEYGLEDHFEDRSSNHVLSSKFEDDKKNKKDNYKPDKKLDKIWKKAKKSGFTDDELADLKREFVHYQEKQKEYDILKDHMDQYIDISENSIDQFKDDDSMKAKKLKLKDKHQDLKKHYESLVSKSDYVAKSGDKMDFEEPKVIQLWALALKANFTDEQLQSLKEELKHFEHKVKKHAYLQEQVDLSAHLQGPPGKRNDQSQNFDQLEEKLKDYSFRVKKYHYELKTKIAKALNNHVEL